MKRLHQGDRVIVIAGKDKGKVGMIISIDRAKDRVKVEGVAQAIRHEKPNPQQQSTGGRLERIMSIHASNVMHYHSKLKKRSRVRIAVDETDQRPKRVLVRDGSAIE